MNYNPDRHHRRSIRLKNYAYTQSGYYFITLCVQNRECLFGTITQGEMQLNETGQLVEKTWQWLAQQYPYVTLDEYIVMPNHFHGILKIDTDGKGASRCTPTDSGCGAMQFDPVRACRDTPLPQHAVIKPLGQLIGAFKTVSTKQINLMLNSVGLKLWQRNYWEHIIRNEARLQFIRQYIVNNSLTWELDQLYPRH